MRGESRAGEFLRVVRMAMVDDGVHDDGIGVVRGSEGVLVRVDVVLRLVVAPAVLAELVLEVDGYGLVWRECWLPVGLDRRCWCVSWREGRFAQERDGRRMSSWPCLAVVESLLGFVNQALDMLPERHLGGREWLEDGGGETQTGG